MMRNDLVNVMLDNLYTCNANKYAVLCIGLVFILLYFVFVMRHKMAETIVIAI